MVPRDLEKRSYSYQVGVTKPGSSNEYRIGSPCICCPSHCFLPWFLCMTCCTSTVCVQGICSSPTTCSSHKINNVYSWGGGGDAGVWTARRNFIPACHFKYKMEINYAFWIRVSAWPKLVKYADVQRLNECLHLVPFLQTGYSIYNIYISRARLPVVCKQEHFAMVLCVVMPTRTKRVQLSNFTAMLT